MLSISGGITSVGECMCVYVCVRESVYVYVCVCVSCANRQVL
jgi:hypothetical protein